MRGFAHAIHMGLGHPVVAAAARLLAVYPEATADLVELLPRVSSSMASMILMHTQGETSVPSLQAVWHMLTNPYLKARVAALLLRAGHTLTAEQLASIEQGDVLDLLAETESGFAFLLSRYRETPHKPPAVNGTNLVEKRNRCSGKPSFGRSDAYFCRVEGFLKLGGNGRDDGNRAVAVGNVILKDERRPGSLNFRAYGRIKRDEVDLAPSGGGYASSSFHTSSSRGNHSSVSWRSRSARRIAPPSGAF
jgi:hypothetical protein